MHSSSTAPISSTTTAPPPLTSTTTNPSLSVGQVLVGVGNGIANTAEHQNQSSNSNNKQITINGKIARSASQIGVECSGNGGALPLTNNKNCDGNKRRKSKSRSNIPENPNYPRNHLDAWLETCLKDSTAPQLSSSSEFLDYNPTSFNTNTKKPPHQQVQQQFFTKTTYPAPFSQGFQKTIPDHHNLISNPYYFNNLMRNSNTIMNDASVDFASLPPIVNVATIGENNILENNLDCNDPTRNFRFSDPCLINPSDSESKMSGQNTPNRRNFDNENNNNNNNKFFITLMEQINLLHETNSKICRNLHDTKIDIEALKNSPNWGLRHRRDSLSGLSTHSQPMGFAFGTQSPAPTYHSGMYTPGIMTDVVREVKDAARVREDALLSRVKSMVEERSWSLGEGNLRMMKDMEELKSQIQHLRSDRKESNKRITHLESENKYMKQLLTSLLSNKTNDILHDHDLLRSTPIHRKNQTSESPTGLLQQNATNRSKRNNFNLHYGIINHNDESAMLSSFSPNDRKSMSLDNPKLEPALNGLRHSNTNSTKSSPQQYNGQLRIIENQYSPGNNSNTNNTLPLETESTHSMLSNDSQNQDVLQMEKDTLELRRELQEALASKKDAENRIIALENVVKNLQVSDERQNMKYISQGIDGGVRNGGSNGSGHGYTNFNNGTSSLNTQRHSNNLQNNNEMSSQNLNYNINHIPSQMQGHSSKLSLAGPITDL